MRVELIPARRLSPELRARWGVSQLAQPELASPFFCPQFTESIGAYHDDVFVALLEHNGQLGFFPFQRTGIRSGRPPGGRLCDYQAVIASAGLHWTIKELLAGCDLDRYQYKRLLVSQEQFSPWHSSYSRSAIIELDDGFDGYSRRIQASGSAVLKKVAAYRRRLERDHGPLRFEEDCRDEKAFVWLLACKSAQYVRTGFEDQFQVPWIADLLRRLHASGNAEFGGMLSVLWAGEQIAAAHLGLRAKQVLHYWFPGYNLDLKSYSPGLILLREIARSATGCGISVIDLGRADAPYKRRFMSGGIAIAEGIVTLASRDSEREQAYCANTSGVHS